VKILYTRARQTVPTHQQQLLTQFERPGYGALSFGDELRLALTHKESSGNEGDRRYKHERDYHPTRQPFETAQV
jgi:hypothetical protein